MSTNETRVIFTYVAAFMFLIAAWSSFQIGVDVGCDSRVPRLVPVYDLIRDNDASAGMPVIILRGTLGEDC